MIPHRARFDNATDESPRVADAGFCQLPAFGLTSLGAHIMLSAQFNSRYRNYAYRRPNMSQNVTSAVAATAGKIKHLRWWICGLLFFVTVINYVDRQVLSVLEPDYLKPAIGWSELEYGRIVLVFQLSYAVMFVVFGRLMDWLGTKVGFAIAVVWWSLAAMGTALARTPFGFGVARLFLGMGEAANFPGAVKTIAEWFPKSERALATGIFNAGTNVGAMIAPVASLTLADNFGWQSAFIVTGALGFVWLLGWWFLYHRPEAHPRLAAEELQHIESDPEEPVGEKVPWLRLLGYRQTWAFAFGKMLTDPIWWFYLFWLPKFLSNNHGIKKYDLIKYLIVVYLIADVGSVAGGWISSALLKRGWTVNGARKTAMLIFAASMPVVILASQVQNVWTAILLIGFAAGAHQGMSANLFTLTSDMFPKRAVGSVMGIGSCAGSLGGVAVAEFAGRVLNADPSFYTPMFVVAGLSYLVALGVIHLLVPKLEPAKL
jgi:ACS family hexuronate transporter-like MFS transporter